jgi:hypothetical protein
MRNGEFGMKEFQEKKERREERKDPAFFDVGNGHRVACHLHPENWNTIRRKSPVAPRKLEAS